MSLVTLTINGNKVQVEQGTTILEACKKLDIYIPTLCHYKLHDNKTVNQPGSCRVCVVEVEGRRNLAPSCCTPVAEGMIVKTNSLRAINARKTVVELMLSDHPKDCLSCDKNLHCELQKIAEKMGIRKPKFEGSTSTFKKDTSSYSIIRDMDKCIYCRRCETMCNEVQTIGVLSGINRGFNTIISPAFDMPLSETNCTFCGQCVAVCPTGALTEVNYIQDVWNALNDKEKVVIVQTAPAIRAALGEEFGLEPGTVVTGKMTASLKRLGFNYVFDTDFAADLTIMEEASEFLNRFKTGGKLPLITSCCPGWIRMLEYDYTDLFEHPSTCKSPQQMFGSIAKTYFAEKLDVKPENLIVVSIMPCLAKKYEASREELSKDGVRDVDIVLSTRELAKMIKQAGIDFVSLKNEDFDAPLGESTGAAVIFGASGGVMEAALRTAHEWITNEKIPNLEFKEVRGFDGLKEATIKIDGIKVNAAVVNGLGNARKLLEEIRAGKSKYHIIEIMACPGGCIGGGGQPYVHGDTKIFNKRIEAIYKEDSNKKLRQSHNNPYITKLYEEFLGSPNSEKAHELLHTHYIKRK